MAAANLAALSRTAALSAAFAQRAAEHDRSGTFPRENLATLREAGLLALTVPRELGGAGAGLARSVEVVGAIAQGEPATALVLAMQLIHHATLARARSWPAAVYERLARSAVEDGALANALRVEPALGTPARGGLPATIARRTADGWRVSGHKIFATGIPVLTWLLVWARTDEVQPRVGTVLVPADSPGVRVEATWDQLGMRATESHDVLLDDVLVPLEFAVDLRPPEAWAAPDPVQAAWNAVLVAAVYHGVAFAARNWLVGWLRARIPSNLGAPLATLPRVQAEMGGIEALLATGARLLRSTAEAVDRGGPDAPGAAECGIVKREVTEGAIRAVERAVAMTGNAGLSRRNPLERHLRDALCGRVHTPQEDTVLLAAGRAALETGEQP